MPFILLFIPLFPLSIFYQRSLPNRTIPSKLDSVGGPAASDYDAFMPEESSRQVFCVKYSLMACNAFGLMMGLFVVLFGMSYPEEKFPGGYQGKATAGISGFFIIFTLIGYYGAHKQKIYLLVIYSTIIILFLGGNLAMWVIDPTQSVLDPYSNTFLVLTGVFLLLLVFALWLAWQERKRIRLANVQISSSAEVPLQQIPNSGTNVGQMSSITTAGVISQRPLSLCRSCSQQHQQQMLI